MKARILSLSIFPGCDGVKVGNGEPGVGGRLLGMTRKTAILILGKPCAHRTPRINEHSYPSLNPHPGFRGQLCWMPCLDWCRVSMCGETNARVVNGVAGSSIQLAVRSCFVGLPAPHSYMISSFPRDAFSLAFGHTSLADVVPLPLSICSVLRMIFAPYSIVL